MAGLARLLAAAALVLAFAGAAQAATDIRINPIPTQVQPQWTPVPNRPRGRVGSQHPHRCLPPRDQLLLLLGALYLPGEQSQRPLEVSTQATQLVLENRPELL